MKKKTFFQLGVVGALTCFLLSAFIYGCRKNSDSGYTAQTITLTAPGKLSNGTILPVGTKISTIKGDPHSLEIDLPSGYLFVGYQLTSVNGASVAVPFTAPVTKVTCSCNSPAGASCSPFTAGGQVGCLAGNCTNCTMTTSSISANLEHGTGEIIQANVVATNEETHFITTLAEMKSKPSAFEAMFNLPGVQKELDKFKGFIDQKDLPQIEAGNVPPGYSYIPAAIYGREVMVMVKQSLTLAANSAFSEVVSPLTAPVTSITCTCNAGSGCVAASAAFGQVKYCNAGNCTSCTLSTN